MPNVDPQGQAGFRSPNVDNPLLRFGTEALYVKGRKDADGAMTFAVDAEGLKHLPEILAELRKITFLLATLQGVQPPE